MKTRLVTNYDCKVFNTNEDGVYTIKSDCPRYQEDIKNNKAVPKVCDWEFCENLICCPKTNLTGARKFQVFLSFQIIKNLKFF